MPGEGLRVDAGPGDGDHPQFGDEALRRGEPGDHPAQKIGTDARAADRDDAHALTGEVAESSAEGLAVGGSRWFKAGHVAGEAVVLFGPVPDRGHVGPEALRDGVLGVTDEDGPVANARVARYLLDHLARRTPQ